MFTSTNTLFNPADFEAIGLLLLLATVVVHIAFAIGVLGDAHALQQEKRYLYFVPPVLWALATLITGLLGVSVYWAINRSMLRRD